MTGNATGLLADLPAWAMGAALVILAAALLGMAVLAAWCLMGSDEDDRGRGKRVRAVVDSDDGSSSSDSEASETESGESSDSGEEQDPRGSSDSDGEQQSLVDYRGRSRRRRP